MAANPEVVEGESNNTSTITHQKEMHMLALQSISDFSPKEKKNIALQALTGLSPREKQQVFSDSGLPSPGAGPTNVIWLVIVITFALVILTSTAFLIYGVIFEGKTADNVQVIVTIFTTATGFAIGLLTPSPTQTGQNSNNTNSTHTT